MDKLAILKTVLEHELTQKVRSSNEMSCLYRGPNGAKCYIGVLMTDDEAVETSETGAVFDLFRSAKEDPSTKGLAMKSFFSRIGVDLSIPDGNSEIMFLANLQRVHDREFAHEDRVLRLQKVLAAEEASQGWTGAF